MFQFSLSTAHTLLLLSSWNTSRRQKPRQMLAPPFNLMHLQSQKADLIQLSDCLQGWQNLFKYWVFVTDHWHKLWCSQNNPSIVYFIVLPLMLSMKDFSFLSFTTLSPSTLLSDITQAERGPMLHTHLSFQKEGGNKREKGGGNTTIPLENLGSAHILQTSGSQTYK